MTEKLTLHDANKVLHHVGNLIGEDENLLTAFVAYIFARRHVVFQGFAGSGKSQMANSIWELVDEDIGLELQGGSEKAIWSMSEEIENTVLLYMTEYQKLAKNLDVKEMIKSHGEGKPYTRRRSINVEGEWITETTTLPVRPMITTIADENEDAKIDDEVGRRTVKLYADPSSAQTKKVLRSKAKRFSAPWMADKPDEVTIDAIKDRVRKICVQEDLPKVAMPGFEEAFIEKIPIQFHESRSVIDHFTDIISGVTRFYAPYRITYEADDGKTYLLATPSDLYEAHTIYKTILLNNSLRLENLGEKVLQIFPDPEGQEIELEHMLTVSDVMKELSHNGLTLPRNKVQAVIASLLIVGYLEEDTTERTPKYHRGPMADSNKALQIDWSQVMQTMISAAEKVLPEDKYAEYVQNVEENKVIAHPVTGEVFNLVDRKKDSMDPTAETAKKVETKKQKTKKVHSGGLANPEYGIQW